MHRLANALVLFLLLGPLCLAYQHAAGTSRLILKDGTPVKLRLSHNVSSADAKTGEQVEFEVLEEVRVGELAVVPKGGVAWGTVTEAQPKKLIGGNGKLYVSVDHVQLASDDKAALRAVKENKRAGQAGLAMLGSANTNSGLLDVVHGKDITIPKGTELTAYVNGDFEIVRARFQPAAPPAAAPAEQAVPSASENRAVDISVLVSSTPPGADIELDGSFVGSTPSIINMPAGDHTIVIKKKSFKAWERKIKAMLGSIKIEAELEPNK